MSECVVRMKKPKSCEECDIATKYQRFGTEICCPFMGWYADYNKCPIFLQLPEEHGRLVDADTVVFATPNDQMGEVPPMLVTVDDLIESYDVPTIVPAERSET